MNIGVWKISLMVGMGQSLRLDGRKVWRIKKADVSQVKRNKAKFAPCRQATSL